MRDEVANTHGKVSDKERKKELNRIALSQLPFYDEIKYNIKINENYVGIAVKVGINCFNGCVRKCC